MKTLILFAPLFFSLALQAQDATSCIIKGNQYYGQQQYEEAEAQYRKALEFDDKNTTAQYNLANSLHKQKKYNEAAELLERLTRETKDNSLRSAEHYNRGVAFTKQKMLAESIESYKDALRLNPNDLQARENLQKALQELKKQQQEQQQQKQKQDPRMSQKEAEQKLKMLQQKEKELQERIKSKNKHQGTGQAEDW